jgi:CTP:molybdopterin cytidylyltransferase MocA
MAEAQILILAAGASARMRGADKLMEPVGGVPLLRHVARTALASGAPVSLTLPPDRPARLAAVQDLPLSRILVADPSGLSASLTAGLARLPPEAPVLLLLADLPEITADDLRLMLREMRETPEMILRGAASDGTPGHPVCFPPWLRAELLSLHGDEGARAVLARHADRLRLLPLPGRHATTDLDTPEDWAAWRAAGPSGAE